jgi:phosphoglycerate kinase
MSHLGKPKGKVVEELRLEPVARHLSTLLNESVLMLSECIGEEIETKIDGMLDGDIVLLENLRFHAEEENNDPEFAKKLASLADVYVNDAFGTAHRAHASTEGVTKFIPAVAGLLMEEEINNLSNILEKPEHPLVCLVGGAKISTKIKVIEKLLERAEKVLLGGALVNNILIEKGQNIGKSKIEKEMAFEAKKLLPYLEEGENKLYMPQDYIVASSPNENAKSRISNGTDLKDFEMILDIGPKTIVQYKEIINNSNMVIWNGPMGLFEIPKFAKGSYEIAQAVADSNAKSIIGGGETLDLVKSLGLEERLTFVSTGGGAMLEFLEGKELPGIAALNDK